MAKKMIILILILRCFLFSDDLPLGFAAPPSFDANVIHLGDKEELSRVIRVLEAYPKVLDISMHQGQALKKMKENEALYEKVQKDLERKQKSEKIIIITLGVVLPIVAGLSGWLGYHLGKTFR